MKVVNQSEIAANFGEYVKATKRGPVVVTSKGKPVASGSEEDLERLLMGHSAELQTILEAARKRFQQGRGIPHETFWKQVEAENAGGRRKRGRAGRSNRTNGQS